MQDRQIVTSIELWMRAYPRRWRAARDEELLDLVVDLAGPDARRLGARAALNVVGRAQAADVAGHDVWLIAGRGRPPALDLPAPTLRPLPGPVPDGAVVQPRRPADPPHLALP